MPLAETSVPLPVFYEPCAPLREYLTATSPQTTVTYAMDTADLTQVLHPLNFTAYRQAGSLTTVPQREALDSFEGIMYDVQLLF